MTIKCPHCGDVYESDEEISVGQHVECPFCANNFYYGTNKTETTFGGQYGYFQRLRRLIVLTLGLSAISTIIGCIDIRECYHCGKVGYFLFEVASLGIQIWLYVAVTQLKSWARKSLIVYNLAGAIVFVLGIGSGFENLFVFMLSVTVCLIDLYCVYLCFQKEVVAIFKPDSELNDARAVVNTMHCFGFWSVGVLLIVVVVVWVYLYQGTEAWNRDCTAAAVAGSSSARESLISFAANQLSDQGYDDPVETATRRIDSYIKQLRPAANPRSAVNPSRIRIVPIYFGLKFLGKVFVVLAAVIGGFFAKSKGR